VNLGVTRSAVANWEGADNILPASTRLAKLAKLTDVNYEWLATGRGAIGYVGINSETPATDGDEVHDEFERRLLGAFRRMRPAARLRSLLRLEAEAMPLAKIGNKART